MRISIVVGNPKRQSRTLRVAEAVANIIADESAAITSIDLVDYADRMFVWPDETLNRLNADVANSDVVVIGSPTYKASCTGLLKAFLDRYGYRGLAGVFAVPVMTIASDSHALAPEFQLRPILVELGAIVPTTAVAFPTPEIDKMPQILDQWKETNLRAISLLRTTADLERSR